MDNIVSVVRFIYMKYFFFFIELVVIFYEFGIDVFVYVEILFFKLLMLKVCEVEKVG